MSDHPACLYEPTKIPIVPNYVCWTLDTTVSPWESTPHPNTKYFPLGYCVVSSIYAILLRVFGEGGVRRSMNEFLLDAHRFCKTRRECRKSQTFFTLNSAVRYMRKLGLTCTDETNAFKMDGIRSLHGLIERNEDLLREGIWYICMDTDKSRHCSVCIDGVIYDTLGHPNCHRYPAMLYARVHRIFKVRKRK